MNELGGDCARQRRYPQARPPQTGEAPKGLGIAVREGRPRFRAEASTVGQPNFRPPPPMGRADRPTRAHLRPAARGRSGTAPTCAPDAAVPRCSSTCGRYAEMSTSASAASPRPPVVGTPRRPSSRWVRRAIWPPPCSGPCGGRCAPRPPARVPTRWTRTGFSRPSASLRSSTHSCATRRSGTAVPDGGPHVWRRGSPALPTSWSPRR
jgi:hypothetical protein